MNLLTHRYTPWMILWNCIAPFRLRTNIRCNQCGIIQKQPIDWVTNMWTPCQNGCDNLIFKDGSGQSSS